MYSYNPNLANAAYLQGLNTSGALKRLIGVNASNKVAIDADALGSTFGGTVTVGQLLLSDSVAPIIGTLSTNAAYYFLLTNASNGAAASAGFLAYNDVASGYMFARVLGTGYTTAGADVQDSAQLVAGAGLSGGLVLATIGAAPLRLGTANVLRLILADDGTYFRPITDNAMTHGDATHRFSDRFTVNDHVDGYTTFKEIADPGVAGANDVRLYARDNGSGKTQLVAIFQSGAVQVLLTEV